MDKDKEYISILYINKPSMDNYIKNLEPDYFFDLNLNQVVDFIMSERSGYNLQPYFYVLPENKEVSDNNLNYIVSDMPTAVDIPETKSSTNSLTVPKKTIYYRQDILKDIINTAMLPELIHFSNLMKNALEYRTYSEQCDHILSKQRWYVDFVISYCKALRHLVATLTSESDKITSAGLIKIINYLNEITNHENFLYAESKCIEIKESFDNLRYGLIIEQEKVIVLLNPKSEDYCKTLNEMFGNLSTTSSSDMANPISKAFKLSELERHILIILMREYPNPFHLLNTLYDQTKNITDDVILRFENEIQFYISYCLYKNHMEEHGYHFSFPHFTDNTFNVYGAYDLALAAKNSSLNKPVIVNDAYLSENERFFIITGPNQGGKTTFARALGQIIYFALQGLPVPCSKAEIPMFLGLASHFSIEESLESGRGKLKDELIRLRTLHEKNIKNYFIVLNELFTTAATYDSYLMGIQVLDYFVKNGCRGVYVTHIKELASDFTSAASLVAELSEKDRHIRTYKIKKRPPDGLGYAESISEKYNMTYDQMKEILKPLSTIEFESTNADMGYSK